LHPSTDGISISSFSLNEILKIRKTRMRLGGQCLRLVSGKGSHVVGLPKKPPALGVWLNRYNKKDALLDRLYFTIGANFSICEQASLTAASSGNPVIDSSPAMNNPDQLPDVTR
jgi:hypothetical protein